jgi:23S rRNA pseudouridine955/2504/2580 synthase
MKTPVQTFTVTVEEAGQKLLQYLSRRLGAGVPQAALQRFIRTGQVRVDSRRSKPFARLDPGQLVRVPPHETGEAAEPPASTEPALARFNLDILHEDADLLVVIKPAGLAVHPGSGQPVALTTLLAARQPDAPFRPTPAHRLDRDTTGVLLVAKSYRALRAIHEAMAAGTIGKDYLAWVRGRWDLGEVNEWVVLRDRLAKIEEGGRELMRPTETGQEAVSTARLLFSTGEASLVEVRLETGRTHQIRAQLGSRGHPVCGDAKYGGGRPPLLLHAWRVSLPGAVFSAPPGWPGAWAVVRPRQAVLERGPGGLFSEEAGSGRPTGPE